MTKKRFYFTLVETWERNVVVLADSEEEALTSVSDGKWDEEHEFNQRGTPDITLEDEEDDE